MKFDSKTVRQGINKAFLKEPVERPEFDTFKNSLSGLLDQINHAVEADEHEEHLKNLLPPFFNSLGFGDYKINTSGRIDLAIYTGDKKNDPVGVLIEVKRPGNKAEMISRKNFNKKALHEAVLYYLEQRIEEENTDLKHVIITNMHDWFIFDAQEFERCFYKPSALRKTWRSWKADQKVSSNNDFMYSEIAKFVETQETSITGLYIPLDKTRKLLGGEEGSRYEKKLIPLYKLFTPIHLLKESFANDSNSLNREFYRELLYILGLEETTEGNTRYIRRASEEKRNPGSFVENTIRILDAEDHLSTVREPVKSYGEDKEEQFFAVALELSITWMNRVLFLKLLEAQLFRYHRGDRKFKFLNSDELSGFDALNTLFFQVLARRNEERSEAIKEKFGHIPYLNSSLFDVSDLEHDTTRISGLTDATMSVYSRSVLNGLRGKELPILDYLFRFLEAYDFSAEGKEEIRSERKSLINASVLGLIFEKINGYKDGSFYTPGFITEYMARETLRKAMTDKFIEVAGIENGEELTISDLYNHIGPNRSVSIEEANEIVNSITICDPAVGSGHFLVSCLNELLAIKSDLGILCDVEGKAFRDLNVTVENDELIVSYGDDELFEYDVSHTWKGQTLASRNIASERQRIQQALFHEKRYLIENCLFGVDINANSVKICRLRLWIELLKRAFYTPESEYLELEVLPNIDINIKQGNSLVSRFELDSDLSSVFKDSDHSLEDYKEAVRNYKQTGIRSEKQRLQKLITEIKEEYTTTLTNIRPINKKLSKERGRLDLMQNADLFGDQKFTKKDIKKQKQKVEKLEEQKAEEESGAFYNQAFEWRFEFPEVLDEEGLFIGFDVVIGNPPYIDIKALSDKFVIYLTTEYKASNNRINIFASFFEHALKIIKESSFSLSFILPTALGTQKTYKDLRTLITNNFSVDKYVRLPNEIFGESAGEVKVDTAIYVLSEQRDESNVEIIAYEGYERIDEITPETAFIHGFKNQKNWTENEEYVWNINTTDEEDELLKKCEVNSISLEEITKISLGLTPYDKYKGQTKEQIEKKVFHADHKKDETFKKLLSGNDVGRYSIKWNGESWISYGDWLGAPREQKFFKEKRILVKQIIDWTSKRIWASITDEELYNTQNAFNILKDSEYELQYILGLLNSKLLTFYHRKKFLDEFKMRFQKILIRDARRFPIKIIDFEDVQTKEKYNSITQKVKQILTAKKENPEADISEFEAEIDRLVYELYGLSEEEIGVVEGSVG